MFYDPNKQKTNLPIFKWLGFGALLFFVFVAGVCVGSAEIEEQPSPESQQAIVVDSTATPIPVPTDRTFPTSAPRPTSTPAPTSAQKPTPIVPVSIDEHPEYLGVVGDCDLALTMRGLAGITEADYAELGRRDGCTEQRVQESLRFFHIFQGVARDSVATEDAAIAAGVPTPTHEPAPTLFTDDPTGRCSASPDCALEVSSSELEDHYRSYSDRWNLKMAEGSGAGAGKRIYTANSKTDAGYYVTWIEREGVGVQLVEMVAPLPMACSMFESFANVQSNLANLMELTIPPPVELNYFGRTYQIGCGLTSSQSKVSDVVNGVLVTVNYVDVEDIRLLDFTFWPCGERAENGACQWSKS